jgi:hypothetical protein
MRWSGVSLPASKAVGPGSVVPHELGGGCVLCCVRREEELSDIVVASMASQVTSFALV